MLNETRYVIGGIVGFFLGIILSLMIVSAMSTVPHINLDNVHYVKFHWTEIGTSEIKQNVQYWTQDQLLSLVSTVNTLTTHDTFNSSYAR
jgi:ABC-type antimicrobial peptide transport system permease subunit